MWPGLDATARSTVAGSAVAPPSIAKSRRAARAHGVDAAAAAPRPRRASGSPADSDGRRSRGALAELTRQALRGLAAASWSRGRAYGCALCGDCASPGAGLLAFLGRLTREWLSQVGVGTTVQLGRGRFAHGCVPAL